MIRLINTSCKQTYVKSNGVENSPRQVYMAIVWDMWFGEWLNLYHAVADEKKNPERINVPLLFKQLHTSVDTSVCNKLAE